MAFFAATSRLLTFNVFRKFSIGLRFDLVVSNSGMQVFACEVDDLKLAVRGMGSPIMRRVQFPRGPMPQRFWR